MENEGKKYLLKRMIKGILSKKEESELLSSHLVTQKMLYQFDNAGDSTATDKTDFQRIWRNLCRGIETGRIVTTRMRVYKTYSVAASFLLLLSISCTFYFASVGKDKITHTLSSGLRNIESVILPDGTTVRMGSGSRLTYPDSFTGKTREITLTGQAFFDIAKDARKPFIVNTAGMKIKAIGTAFEVFNYDEKATAETILLNGSVQVSVINEHTGKETFSMLKPNERLIFDRTTGSTKIETVDADKYTGWRNQQSLSFENEKLSVIIPRLERWYGCKILINEDIAEKHRNTIKVRDESLEDILYLICESSSLKYSKSDNGDYTLISK